MYSAGAMNREFGSFTGDVFTLLLVGYDFAKTMHVKYATLTGNYLYQHPDINNTLMPERSVSILSRSSSPSTFGICTSLNTA